MSASAFTFRGRMLALAVEYERLQMENFALKEEFGVTTPFDQQGKAVTFPVHDMEFNQPLFPSTPSFDNEVATESIGHLSTSVNMEVPCEFPYRTNHSRGFSDAVQEAELLKSNTSISSKNPTTTTMPAAESGEDILVPVANDEATLRASIRSQAEQGFSSGSKKKSVTVSENIRDSVSTEMMQSFVLGPQVAYRKDDGADPYEMEFSRHDSFLPGFEKASPQLQSEFEVATLRALEECYTTSKDSFVMSPLSYQRLLWDFILFSCVLFELWVTPFELFFLHMHVLPQTFRNVSNAMTIFFFIDILANFNTGYISRGDVVMKRSMIAREYTHGWFWLDLLCTVPFDWIFSEFGGTMVRGVKAGKAFRIIRAARYIRLMQSYGRRRHMANNRRQGLRFVAMARPITPVLCILLVGHFHACMWAALSQQRLELKFVDALQNYYQCFWQAWICLFLGVPVGPEEGNFDSVFLFDMLVSVERILLLAVGGVWAVVYAHTQFSDYIKMEVEKDSAIKYLKSHAVSMETQLQFRFSLEEMAKARMRQTHFHNLVAHDQVTGELHRRICCELWASRLMSFGLITQIAAIIPGSDFIIELCLCVREEVFASKAVLFHYGDAAIAAYCVLTGQLFAVKVFGSLSSIPDYEPGHWLGETALVNPQLRRAMSVITQDMSELMAVPADGFQRLLERFGLTEYFQEFIQNHLWKGICARCGVLGDHFADRCPGITAHRYTKSKLRNTSKKLGSMITASARMRSWTSVKEKLASADELPEIVQPTGIDGIASDLFKYLKEMNLLHRKEDLKKMGIVTLDDLLCADQAALRASLPANLDVQELECFSPEGIELFLSQASFAVQKHFFVDISTDHYIFLSHSKLESGTEAALMRTELEILIRADTDSTLNDFSAPIFLDSEDLQSLTYLQDAVNKSHNLVLLLAPHVLERVWVLVEIATAKKFGVRIVPVHISKPGTTFEFPDEDFYEKFLAGGFIKPGDQNVLDTADLTLEEAEVALRSVFKEIAVPYSPHVSAHMRKAQLECLLKRCRLK